MLKVFFKYGLYKIVIYRLYGFSSVEGVRQQEE